MSHEEFKKIAQEMFDGQFPNRIVMRVPRGDFMSVTEKEIRGELKEWVNVTIDKYREFLATPKELEETE
jgi:hypothetical protein